MPVDEITMLYRILIAGGLGLLIGLERERHGRAAGLRTCILVSLAGALLMSLSLHLSQIFAAGANESVVRLDPGRLPSYAIAGMGFLGAGAIIQGRGSAIGITTAAAMWTCTGLGLAVGAGLYVPSFVVTGLALFALVALRGPGRKLRHEQSVTLTVESRNPDTDQAVHQLLKEYGVKVLFVGRQRCLDTDTVTYSYFLSITAGPQWSQMLSRLEEIPGVSCYTWNQAEVR